MYNKFFLKLEDRINEANGVGADEEPEEDGEKIFHDKLDTALEEKSIGWELWNMSNKKNKFCVKWQWK